MNNVRRFKRKLTFTIIGLMSLASAAPSWGLVVIDDFTQQVVNDSPGNGNGINWATVAPACLTAGTATTNNGTSVATSSSTYSNIPACSATTGSGITKGKEDAAGAGALRLTNNAYNQAGAIISQSQFPSNLGLQVTFTAYSYGTGLYQGADGMGFFISDASVPVNLPYVGANVTTGTINIGESGGSLGYSCANTPNAQTYRAAKPTNYNGVTGAYIGLGMDEYGNYLNQNDNSATGIGSVANTIGLRGAGNVSWYWLSTNYPIYYPTTLSAANQLLAVENSCATGTLWDNSGNNGNPTNLGVTSVGSGPAMLDYAMIPNGYVTLPSSQPIPSAVATRAKAKPITYRLTLTPSGLLSFMYNFNSATNFTPVLTNFDIQTANGGAIPTNFRFGFLGSTGSYADYHEITCFSATPTQSSSGTGANAIEAGPVRTGTQIYLASYNSSYWTGSLQSIPLVATTGTLTASSTANWDAGCGLTGGVCDATGGTTVTAITPASRTLMTWDTTAGKGTPFEWPSTGVAGINTAQKAVLNTTYNKYSNGQYRLNWLRGDRTQETSATPAGLLRTRAGVLGDIINSSPVWVGPPSVNIQSAITDGLYGSVGSESPYPNFVSTMSEREQVVYVGSNDGFLHGFRAGNNNADGSFSNTTNDGQEVLGFIPGGVLANTTTKSTNGSATNTVTLADPTYGHSFYVDAAPGTGDLYYGPSGSAAWHTWLVGGLGQGGAEIYALDITDPTGAVNKVGFSESNASSIVIGDWTSSSLTTMGCVNVTSPKHCGDNLGNTYGTPLIRRMHNGQFAIIFGNGYASTNQHAGVYIGLVSSTTGAVSFYWLDTGVGSSSKPNGIAYVTSADLDGDHIVDYLYAGDLQGNVWRFDVTSSNPADWAASTYGQTTATPLFVAQDSLGNLQPITTQVLTNMVTTNGVNRMIVTFGTGRALPISTGGVTTYAQTGTQSMYGIWDWNMGSWNTGTTTPNSVSVPASTTSMSSLTQTIPAIAIGRSNLYANTLASSTSTSRYVAPATVCWVGTTCQSGTTQAAGTQYGWYYDFTGTSGSGATTNYEQIVFNPRLNGGTVFVNTTTAAPSTSSQCASKQPTNWTMSFDATTGGGETSSVFPDTSTTQVSGAYLTGIQTNAVGSPYFLYSGGRTYAISPTVGGGPASINAISPSSAVLVKRVSWEQIR